MAKNSSHIVRNSDGDFAQVQNYAIQLAGEKKISQQALIMYLFYRSLAGFTDIRCSFEYIHVNTSVSVGACSKGLKQLEEQGLVEVKRFGANKVFEILLVPGSNLPRRTLKSIKRTGGDNDATYEPEGNFIAASLRKEEIANSPLPEELTKGGTKAKYEKAKHFDSTDLSIEAAHFWDAFTTYWCKMSKTAFYRKKDMHKLDDIKDYALATKMIPVMWLLADVDKWTKDSDKSLSVFATLYNLGKLEAHYPKTSLYYST